VTLYIESSIGMLRMRAHISFSMILIAMCFASYIPYRPHACLGKSAQNAHGRDCNESPRLLCTCKCGINAFATDKNQPTLARYHISGHNINLDISHSYGSVIWNVADLAYNVLEVINTVV